MRPDRTIPRYAGPVGPRCPIWGRPLPPEIFLPAVLLLLAVAAALLWSVGDIANASRLPMDTSPIGHAVRKVETEPLRPDTGRYLCHTAPRVYMARHGRKYQDVDFYRQNTPCPAVPIP